MKKLMVWTASGFGLALACGLSGLPHLSATVITLTAFAPCRLLLVVALDVLSRRGVVR